MRVYMGFRMAGFCHVFTWDAARPARPLRLDPRLDLWNHSPSGFEWGYAGAGPAQLALALAADALGDGERAIAIHQALKFAVVGKMPRDCWSLTRDQICEAINRLEQTTEPGKGANHGQQA